MKRNILMYIVLVALGGLAYYLVTNDKEQKNITIDSYDLSYRDFALKNVEEVSKIIVVNRNKGVFTFKKKNDVWYVNDTFKANPLLVKNMLSVINNVKIDYVPTVAAEKNIMKSMMLNGIKVEIYNKNNEPLKKYYVGGSPQNSVGTYFVMDGYSKPLVMTIPGFKGNLRVRFSYSLNNWRDRTIFGEQVDNIYKVGIKYFVDKKSSFELIRDEDKFKIAPAFDIQKRINKPLDQKFASAYLVGFTKKIAEGIVDDKSFIDDIVSQNSLAEIELERKNGTKINLKIYLMPSFERDSLPDNDGIYRYFNTKVHRYFALDNKGDLFQIQYRVFKDIFIPYYSFFNK